MIHCINKTKRNVFSYERTFLFVFLVIDKAAASAIALHACHDIFYAKTVRAEHCIQGRVCRVLGPTMHALGWVGPKFANPVWVWLGWILFWT